MLIVGLAGPASAGDVDFARDVLPILSDNCFFCHGPDEAARKGGLRLDTKEGAFRKKTHLVPGKSGESEVISRVVSTDADEQMPPPDSNRKLTAKQVATLKKWVDEGATWGQHWAYVPLPRTVAVPTQNSSLTAHNSVDNFIQARLAKEGLKPSPPATKAAWLRRVTLDLTGLPPTLAEVDAFAKDDAPAAFERVVDRLLASPRYGERMAADWLDVARYADTHGYQSDRFRPMWAYRDWVVKSFNANTPFDRFATEQLAGDLLPNATKDQRLATAFNRLHMQNEEGGIVEEEFRVAYVVDRVTTFGTAFLGQTLECCRCHDHKYDPLSQTDFYGLFAFFQNIDESGQTSYFTSSMPVPALPLTTDEQDKKIAELAKRIAAKEAEFAKLREDARPPFEKWLADPDVRQRYEKTGYVGHFPLLGVGKEEANAADPKKPGRKHESPKVVLEIHNEHAVLDGENGFVFPGIGHFTRADAFTISLSVRPPEKHAPRSVIVHHTKAPIDAGSRGYELLLEDGKVAFGLHHMWPGNSLKVRTKEPIPANRWANLAATYDGSSRADGVRIYVNGVAAPLEVVRDKLTKDITYGGEPDLAIGFRFRDSGFKDGAVSNFRVLNRVISAPEAAHFREGNHSLLGKPLLLCKEQPYTPAEREQLFEHFLLVVHAPAAQWRKELFALRDEQRKFVEPIPDAMVMQEMPTPKPARLLKRGAYDAPGDPVATDTPKALPPFPADLPRNRLGLAKWLTHPDHPLFARVTVNRLWQQMFGRGLVETSDNFGTTGVPPTHPDLLDWLARDFTRDYDVKRMLKQLALSATYRQSSRMRNAEFGTRNENPSFPRSELRIPHSEDPYNHLLARFPARRLTAEMLRDQALATSGLLNDKVGGPSVYPYQPDGLWNEAMGRPHYPQSKGADLYRRSLYTVWKRTAPHPQMTTFDAADRSNCSVRRQTTGTPLQALALLNDPQFVEAARFLGQRMLTDGGANTKERAAWTFRTVTGRPASEKELAVLVTLFDEQRAEFAKDAKAAEKLLTVGDGKADAKLDKLELAAATQLALAILNHDEAVNRR